MTTHWTHKIVIAGMTVALGLPVATTYAQSRDRDDRSERRNNEEVPDIVREARIVREGRGEELEYKAPEDGQVWLYDATNKKVLHSIALRTGNTYGINPRNDYVLVNGKEGEGVKLDRDNSYRIYYVTAEDRDAKNDRTRRDRDTETRRDSTPAREKAKVPDTAKLVMEGRDEELSVKAEQDGTFYLYDASEDRVLETYNLESGQRITVAPKGNAISIDGKTISRDIELSRKTTYRLLFDKKR